MSLALLLILFSHLRFWPIVCRSVKQSKYLSQRRVMVMTKCYFWSAWIITSVSTLSLHVQNKVEWTIALPVYHNPFFNIEETYVYFLNSWGWIYKNCLHFKFTDVCSEPESDQNQNESGVSPKLVLSGSLLNAHIDKWNLKAKYLVQKILNSF